MCKYYDGFLGKPTDFRKCDKMEVLDIIEFKTSNLTIAF